VDVGNYCWEGHRLGSGLAEQSFGSCLGSKCSNRIACSPSTQVTGSAATVVCGSIRRGDDEAVTGKDRGGNIAGLTGGLGSVVDAGSPVASRVKKAANAGSAADKAW
jgi:hypothetical protein